MAAILNQGLTAIRDAIKTTVSHVGVATDQTAFSASQTAIDPANGGAANLLIKTTSAENDIDFQTAEFQMTIDGDTEFTGKTIWTIGVCDGATRTDAMSRTVRSVGIGVQAGDSYTLGVRVKSEDNSA